MSLPRNRIYNQSYTAKRFKDSGFYVCKIFDKFSKIDNRNWVILINPYDEAVFVTCYVNKQNYKEVSFEINDGGNRFAKNFSLITDSFEVLCTLLIEKGITTNPALPYGLQKQ